MSYYLLLITYYQKIGHVLLPTTYYLLPSGRSPSERDSSGTTEARNAPKVMERIARREPRRAPSRTMVRQCAGGEAARPNILYMLVFLPTKRKNR
jgi:hypothetical protein